MLRRFVLTLALFLMAGPWTTINAAQSTGSNPMVRLTTTLGVIDIELFTDAAPLSVANFLEYVEDGFYDGLIFHRVIPGFMIQGGGFLPGMDRREPRAPIENEADNGLKNDAGTLSMARTNDPHSATSQFFISVVDNKFLDHTAKTPQGWGYAVFGKVMAGMDVVQAIADVPRGQVGSFGDVPNDGIVVESAMLISK
jgi:peptidyl-prolyl cis-trans isomerase B (cyclophilin B)